ncbi:GNAT family N-acetyltransferase [Paenibacillus sp. P96]|uniref:GNAT family N-acetyltransferase n=1 Tax=Paenibacillus zeirhizosphaerae TaxID=2987519 RepID=A0ABT9FTG5_9BACL|nr:GNAT family N-acetyltransferase [Paenibacillus sp. P96]MDP4097996.1 GNAT family N-acetyltransferase [Paenibacillus sp. P96]
MITLREAALQDLPEMLAIYNEAVLNSTATFDLEAQTLEERTVWFHKYGDKHPLIVAEADGKVAGYACLSPFRAKPAYVYSTELSIYIDSGFRGRRIGSTLMTDILERASALGYHTVISGLVGGNEASRRLHEKFGFSYIGAFKEVGLKFGEWHDVHFYQLFMEPK